VSRFHIVRTLLRRSATPQLGAPNGDSPLAPAPVAIIAGGETIVAEAIAAPAAKTTPVQIVLIVLGVIAFLYFARRAWR